MGDNGCACQICVPLLGILAPRLPGLIDTYAPFLPRDWPGLIDAYAPFRPPEAEERQKAVGKLNSLSLRL